MEEFVDSPTDAPVQTKRVGYIVSMVSDVKYNRLDFRAFASLVECTKFKGNCRKK